MMKKLGELVDFIRGVTYAGGEASRSMAEGSLPVLRAGNIGQSLNLEEDLVWVPASRVHDRQKLKAGDIVMCLSSGSSHHVGKTALVEQDWTGSIGGFCGIIRPTAYVSPSFLALWLRSPEFLLWRDSQSRGSNIQNLQFSELSRKEVKFPLLHEQNRIAAELDEQLSTIDEARQAAERRVAAAEALEAALFRELFHGLSPVLIGLPKEAAPAGWKWTRLLDLADLESGHTPSRRHPEWWGGEIPWLALPDIRALDGKVAMETKEQTNPLGIANSSARILPKDTVALSRTASVGFVTIFGRPMATSQDFVNWICGKELSPAFLLHAMRASRQHFLANASGAIHKTLYMPAVKDFHLCHPTRKAQETLASTLDLRLADTATLLAAARAELAAIRALPAAALRRVFAA